LTAETVIDALEDAEDYAAFEMAVTADYDPQSVVERELVLRLASLLWRLRRATAIESDLFKIQAKHLLQFRQRRQTHQGRPKIIESTYRREEDSQRNDGEPSRSNLVNDDLTRSLVRLSNLPTYPLDRLSRMRPRFGIRRVRSCSRCSVLTAAGHDGCVEPDVTLLAQGARTS
jgi:hypothetical protein